MKNILVFSLVILTNLVMNLAVFLMNYNKLATPFLHEEQKVENANYIVAITVPSFIGVAVVSAFIIYFITRKKL